MQMSSGRRFSLEQLMVESGQLEPEQTLNHHAWGPLSVPPCSAPDSKLKGDNDQKKTVVSVW